MSSLIPAAQSTVNLRRDCPPGEKRDQEYIRDRGGERGTIPKEKRKCSVRLTRTREGVGKNAISSEPGVSVLFKSHGSVFPSPAPFRSPPNLVLRFGFCPLRREW